MKIKHFAGLVLLALVLSGCNGERWCAKHHPCGDIVKVDSFTQIEYRDTVVFVDGPVLTDTFRVGCDSNGQVVITGGNGTIQYVYRDRWLSVSADCPDTALVIKRYKENVRVAKERQVTERIKERYIPWYVKILAWAGGISLAFFGAKAGMRWFLKSV